MQSIGCNKIGSPLVRRQLLIAYYNVMQKKDKEKNLVKVSFK